MLFYLGVGTAFAVLWGEPRWSIYLVCAALIVGFAAWMTWMSMPYHPDTLNRYGLMLVLAALFAAVGPLIVIFRGAHARAKQRQLDAEIDEIVGRNKS